MTEKKTSKSSRKSEVTITIPDYSLPSRNAIYRSNNWRKRKTIVDNAKQVISAYIPNQKAQTPVNIRVDAHYKHNRRRDSDNVEAKLIIDTLCGNVIPDDDPRYVHNVTTRSHIGQSSDKVVITISHTKT